jgi:cation-transporting ATPase 13A1
MYTSQGDLMRTIQFASDRMTVGNKEAFLFIGMLLAFAVVASGYVLQAGLADGRRDLSKLILHCVIIIVSVGGGLGGDWCGFKAAGGSVYIRVG